MYFNWLESRTHNPKARGSNPCSPTILCPRGITASSQEFQYLAFALVYLWSKMTALYSLDDFNKSKSREKLPLLCKCCGKTFYVLKKQILIAIKNNIDRSTCSPFCYRSLQNPSVGVVCFTCGKNFDKKQKQIRKSPRHFCCRSCANKYSSNVNKEQKTANQKKWAKSECGLLTMKRSNRQRFFNREEKRQKEKTRLYRLESC